MKITAISGLLLVGAASLVSAAPAKDETAERVSYNDTKKAPAPPVGDWVELASPTPAKHGREFVTVDGRYTHLRVDAHAGRPHVKAVRVIFADGKQRVVGVDRVLGGKRPTALIDLPGAPMIDHVVIVTDAKSKGSYTVSGAPAQRAEVATR